MADRRTTVWKDRLWALLLVLAYVPAFVVPRSTFENLSDRFSAHGWDRFWALYTVTSCGMVTAALLIVLIVPRRVPPRLLLIAKVFLIAYWAPHTFLVNMWVPLQDPRGWID